MSTQLKEKINISVDNIETLTDVDLADLCNITEQAIKAGGGFGWVKSSHKGYINRLLD